VPLHVVCGNYGTHTHPTRGLAGQAPPDHLAFHADIRVVAESRGGLLHHHPAGHPPRTGHDGVFLLAAEDVPEYVKRHHPTILRWDKRADTLGLHAMNIGVSKGSTFDRMLIFPTRPITQYLMTRDHTRLKARERLYVAVT